MCTLHAQYTVKTHAKSFFSSRIDVLSGLKKTMPGTG